MNLTGPGPTFRRVVAVEGAVLEGHLAPDGTPSGPGLGRPRLTVIHLDVAAGSETADRRPQRQLLRQLRDIALDEIPRPDLERLRPSRHPRVEGQERPRPSV